MGHGRHLVWLYKAILEHTGLSLALLHGKWEDDLGRAVHDAGWEQALKFPQKVSHNARFKRIQFSILHRTNLTPAQFNFFFPNAHLQCPRGSRAASQRQQTSSICCGSAQVYPDISHLSTPSYKRSPHSQTSIHGKQAPWESLNDVSNKRWRTALRDWHFYSLNVPSQCIRGHRRLP